LIHKLELKHSDAIKMFELQHHREIESVQSQQASHIDSLQRQVDWHRRQVEKSPQVVDVAFKALEYGKQDAAQTGDLYQSFVSQNATLEAKNRELNVHIQTLQANLAAKSKEEEQTSRSEAERDSLVSSIRANLEAAIKAKEEAQLDQTNARAQVHELQQKITDLQSQKGQAELEKDELQSSLVTLSLQSEQKDHQDATQMQGLIRDLPNQLCVSHVRLEAAEAATKERQARLEGHHAAEIRYNTKIDRLRRRPCTTPPAATCWSRSAAASNRRSSSGRRLSVKRSSRKGVAMH
jgi:hypothetical protein